MSSTRCAPNVSLPVLSPNRVRKSRMSRWRAAVLILVNLLIGVHILQWWLANRGESVGRTLAPVEPSESMYTIQNGQLNPGVVFFGLAILSTLLLGRWVCGWGCHIIALQDLCTWLLEKVRIKPKPFRTRIVLWATSVMAFYMFAWPAVHRWILTPWLGEKLPLYLGRSTPWPGLEQHMLVEDLWATMPSIWVAIPFILVSCFVVVYFLGAKGYCAYGCPYGALFAPSDRLAPMRIVVNENCEGCGHCTAVCTSNVRVHEEVRDYGMVVSPGCMKCMDCVAVCPKDALSFGLGKPAPLAKARPASDGRPHHTPKYDLSLGEDLALFAVWVAVLFGIRGTMTWVPLLFASALAGLAVFGVAKTRRLLVEPNVKAGPVQLKLKGRLKPAGVLAALLTLGLLGASVWSGYVRMYLRDTAAVDHYLLMRAAAAEQLDLFGKDPATPETAALAETVRDKLVRSSDRASGGVGWRLSPMDLVRLAQAQLILRDSPGAEAACRAVLIRESPQNPQIAAEFLRIMALRGAAPEEMHRQLDEIIAAHPEPGAACLAKASLLGSESKFDDAKAYMRKAFYSGPATDPATQVEAIKLLLQAGEAAEARSRSDAAIAARPWSADLRVVRAVTFLVANEGEPAERDLREAVRLAPKNIGALALLAQVVETGGKAEEAKALRLRIEKLQRDAQTGPAAEQSAPNAN